MGWMRFVGRSQAQLILALTPLVAITLAHFFLDEEITESAWVGGALVIAASLLASLNDFWKGRRLEAAEAAAAAKPR